MRIATSTRSSSGSLSRLLVVAVTISAAGCASLLDADFDRAADPNDPTGAPDGSGTDGASSAPSCESGKVDCNGVATDGCESEVVNDPKNCGVCGRACSSGLVCGDSTCLSACPDGTRACGGACKPESVTSCGPGCMRCTAPPYGAALCATTGCDFTCRDGYSRQGAECVDTMASNTWTQAAQMPTARNSLAAVAAGGLVYAIGGSSSTPLGTFEAYDPRTDSWTKLPDMPTPRLGLAAAAGADGRIYAIGGGSFDPTSRRATVEAYDPATKTWTTVASMPTARVYLAAVAGKDGRIYALGGITGRHAQDTLGTVEAYSPSTSSWTTVASMSTKRAHFAAAVDANGRIIAVGGDTYPPNGPSADVYTPASNSWATVANMTTPRLALAAAMANGVVFAIGGLTSRTDIGSYSPSTDGYAPGSNAWAPRAAMPTSRSFFAAASLEGRIYAVGGQRKADERLSTVEVYKP